MPAAGWSPWNANNGGSGVPATANLSAVVAAGGGSNSWEVNLASETNFAHSWAYQVAAGLLPSTRKYCLASVAVRGEGALATSDCVYGLGFLQSGLSLSGDHNRTDVNGIVVGVQSGDTLGASANLRAVIISGAGASTAASARIGSGTTIPIVNNGFVQFQAACLINDINWPEATAVEIAIWTRHNTGSSLSAPGSAGWTSWVNHGVLWPSINGSAYQLIQSAGGINPSFGHFGGSTFSTGATSRINYDQITVEYGTYTP